MAIVVLENQNILIMKIDGYDKSSSGKRIISFRTNAYELEVIKSLLENAIRYTPPVPSNKDIRLHMRNMMKAFDKVDLEKLKEYSGNENA